MTNADRLRLLAQALKNAQIALKKAIFDGNLGQAGYHANTIAQIQDQLSALAKEMVPTPNAQ